MGWRLVELGKVASLIKRPVTPVPGTAYRRIGVRLWGQGAYERATVDGVDTKYASLYEVHEGDIVVNKIWARNGSVSVVSSELSDCFGSPEFPTYAVDPAHMMSDWFGWFTHSPALWAQCAHLSKGTSGQNRLRPERFLSVRVPLPPISEQRRIVARFDRTAALIDEAKKLIEDAALQAQLLTYRLHVALSGNDVHRFDDLVELWEDREAVLPNASYPQVGIKGFAGGLFRKSSIMGSETSYRAFNRLHEGLLVVSQPKGWEGAIAVCDESVAGWFVSPEYRTFRCRKGRLMPRYLAKLIETPWFQSRLARLTRGQGARRQRLRPEMLLSMEIEMPNMDAQAGALEILDRCHAAQTRRSISAKMLDALIPAMLHEVFSGDSGRFAMRPSMG